LKILHIGKYFSPFSGGLENYMRDAMVALGRRGVESAALVHRHSLSVKTSDDTFNAGRHSFQVVRAAMWARLSFAPISPTFAWHMKRLIKTFKPDILHLHLPNASAFWALLLPSARRIPWVVHWHADVITSDQGWLMKLLYILYRPFERALLKRAQAIVATSLPYRDSSEPLQPWINKCHVVPLGVDAERFAVGGISEAGRDEQTRKDRSQQSWPLLQDGIEPHDEASPLQVLAVGRLTYYKGFRYLIEAAANSLNIHINLVGKGDQARELKALATSLNVQDRVTFHGVLTDADLAQKMIQADCICLPSIERTEAFGMVLLEAMYFGKATVISDVSGSGMGWIVDADITGLKVAPADAGALATAFERLNANRDELATMGRRGKKKFNDQFEINHAINRLIEVYQQMITTRS
jgi:glycosyltransferase involved in cell wall biosynthesis